jgi:Cys-tRNA(Pro)/Cys-tRNA(Cys) deacylase
VIALDEGIHARRITHRSFLCYDRRVKPVAKTNAMRILESLSIPFETAAYPFGDEHKDAVTVAGELGVSADLVWKTLVAHDESNAPLVFVIPGPSELNLKKAARAAEAKKVELISLRDLTPLTGYVRGGCSPVGMKKSFPTFVDEMVTAFDRIYVNAGARGIQVIIAPADLLRAANAKVADLV